MTKSSRFFSDGSYYNQPDFAKLMKDSLSDGFVPDVGSEMAVLATSPTSMTVTVGTGRCYIQGYSFDIENDVERLTLEPASTQYARIDRVVARLSMITDKNIDVAVLTGTPSASPIAPELTQGDDIWEISLATISVAASATYVSQSNITDTRPISKAAHIREHAATHHSGGTDPIGDATQTVDGLMSAADKTKMDNLRVIHKGTADPSSSLGVDGDLYAQYSP